MRWNKGVITFLYISLFSKASKINKERLFPFIFLYFRYFRKWWYIKRRKLLPLILKTFHLKPLHWINFYKFFHYQIWIRFIASYIVQFLVCARFGLMPVKSNYTYSRTSYFYYLLSGQIMAQGSDISIFLIQLGNHSFSFYIKTFIKT